MIWMPLWHSTVACFTRIKKPSPAPPISTGGQNHANRSNHPEMVSHTPRSSCVRFAAAIAVGLAQHSLPGGALRLTWAGLPPADRASFLALLCPPYARLLPMGKRRFGAGDELQQARATLVRLPPRAPE